MPGDSRRMQYDVAEGLEDADASNDYFLYDDEYCDDWFGCDCAACLESVEVGQVHLDKAPLTQRLKVA